MRGRQIDRIGAPRSKTNRENQEGFAVIRPAMDVWEMFQNELFWKRIGLDGRLEAARIVDSELGRISDSPGNSVVLLTGRSRPSGESP